MADLNPLQPPYQNKVTDPDGYMDKGWLSYFTSWAGKIIAGAVNVISGTPGRIVVGGTQTAPIINIDPAYVASPVQGGTGHNAYTLGDTLYASGLSALTRLPGAVDSFPRILTQTGTGAVSAAPAWMTRSELLQVFNVLDYGAYGGHLGTIHDELIPIQNCILAAKAAGANAVYLPPGDYGISNTIDLHALLGISNSLVNQGYFTLYGDNPGTTRIIPTANITGAMIECVNAGTDNAANGRDFRFHGFSLYSDARLNKSADYGFRFRWCAQVFYNDVNVINCCNKRLVWHDTTFVVNMTNCNFVGKANELADAGSGGAPDGPSNAMNFPPVSYDDRLVALYFSNTCTTTKIDTCRMNSCRIGINFANGDVFSLINPAIESCEDYGAFISGSTTNINILGDYWEGNAGSGGIGGNVYIGARCDNLTVSGNFFHGANYGIKIVGASILSGIIEGNSFSSCVDGIIFDAPVLSNLEVAWNTFDVDNSPLVYPYDTFNSYGNQGHRINWHDNYVENNTEARRFTRIGKNLNSVDFSDWTATGAVSIAASNKKLKVANTYDITTTDQGEFLSTEIASIGAANANLAGSWMTILLPIYFTSIYTPQDVGVTFSNSAGDLLCTHITDFPDGSTVQFSVGVMPGNIAANTSYQVVRITATTCKLTAGAGNIAYSSAGSGTITMTFYQPGGKIRVDDGVAQSDFLIGGTDLNVWKTARCYVKLSDSASTLSLRLYPNAAAFTVENVVVLKGLWGDSEARANNNPSLYMHPGADGGIKPFKLYQKTNPNIVIAHLDNPGSPAYGALGLNDAGGDPGVTCNGGTGQILSYNPTGGIGYAAGAGGTVTQSGSKSTGVTLNKVSGKITLDGGALAAGTPVSFTLTNSTIAAADGLILNLRSGGTPGAYAFDYQCAAGSAVITVRNITAGSLSEAIVIGFILVKGATS